MNGTQLGLDLSSRKDPHDPKGAVFFYSRHRLAFKIICWVVILSFLMQEVSMAQGGPTEPSAKPASSKIDQALDLRQFSIPRNIGSTREVKVFDSKETIINIKDAHDNLSSQESIVSILDNLFTNYDIKTVAVEGSVGYIDTSIISSFPDKLIKKKLADELMAEGRISAAEYFSSVMQSDVALYGIDDKALYSDNMAAFKAALGNKDDNHKKVAILESALAALEERIYSDDLKLLEHNSILKNNGKAGFTKRWDAVRALGEKNGIHPGSYPNISNLLKAIELEKKCDFERTNVEREALLNELKTVLDKKRLEELILKSLSFKLAKISASMFYSYMVDQARLAKLDLAKYPNIIVYVEYMSLYEGVDMGAIKDEVIDYENAIKEKIYRNDDERKLSALMREASVLSDLLEVKLTATSLNYFKAHRDEFKPQGFSDFIKSMYAKYKMPLPAGLDVASIFEVLEPAEKFYELTLKRNNAMVANTINQMRKSGQTVAALVTGGFHSEGISEILKEDKVSYLVILPKADATKKRPYLTIITNNKKSYQELLDSGQFYIALETLFNSAEFNIEIMARFVLLLMSSTERVTPQMVKKRMREYLDDYKSAQARLEGVSETDRDKNISLAFDFVDNMVVGINRKGERWVVGFSEATGIGQYNAFFESKDKDGLVSIRGYYFSDQGIFEAASKASGTAGAVVSQAAEKLEGEEAVIARNAQLAIFKNRLEERLQKGDEFDDAFTKLYNAMMKNMLNIQGINLREELRYELITAKAAEASARETAYQNRQARYAANDAKTPQKIASELATILRAKAMAAELGEDLSRECISVLQNRQYEYLWSILMRDRYIADIIEKNLRSQGIEDPLLIEGAISRIISEFSTFYNYGEREDGSFDTAYQLRRNTVIKDESAAKDIANRGKDIIKDIKRSIQDIQQAEDAEDAAAANEKARTALAAVVSGERAERLRYLRASLDRADRARNTSYIDTLSEAIDSLKRDTEWALKLGVVIEKGDAERLSQAGKNLEAAVARMQRYGFDTGYISGLLNEFTETVEKFIARSVTPEAEILAAEEAAKAEKERKARERQEEVDRQKALDEEFAKKRDAAIRRCLGEDPKELLASLGERQQKFLSTDKSMSIGELLDRKAEFEAAIIVLEGLRVLQRNPVKSLLELTSGMVDKAILGINRRGFPESMGVLINYFDGLGANRREYQCIEIYGGGANTVFKSYFEQGELSNGELTLFLFTENDQWAAEAAARAEADRLAAEKAAVEEAARKAEAEKVEAERKAAAEEAAKKPSPALTPEQLRAKEAFDKAVAEAKTSLTETMTGRKWGEYLIPLIAVIISSLEQAIAQARESGVDATEARLLAWDLSLLIGLCRECAQIGHNKTDATILMVNIRDSLRIKLSGMVTAEGLEAVRILFDKTRDSMRDRDNGNALLPNVETGWIGFFKMLEERVKALSSEETAKKEAENVLRRLDADKAQELAAKEEERIAAEEAAKAAQGVFESMFGGNERADEVLEFLGFERSAGIISYYTKVVGGKPHIKEHVLKASVGGVEREVRFFTKDLPRTTAEKENRIGEAAFRAGVGPKCTMLTDAQGQTTLLQMTPNGIDLRTFKAQVGFKDKDSAKNFVRLVANALGRLHGAGYTHEDLSGIEGLRGSHIFVEVDSENNITSVRFIDFGIGLEGTDSNKGREKIGVLDACVDTIINMAGLDIADAMKLVKDVFDGEYGKGLIEGESSVPAAEVARRAEEKARAAREAEEAEVKRKAEAAQLLAEREMAAQEAAKAVAPQAEPIDADLAAAQDEAKIFGLDTTGTAADIRSRVRDRLIQYKNAGMRLFLDANIDEALAQLEEARKLDFKSRQNYRDVYMELLNVTMYIDNYREIIKALEVADTLSAKDLAVMLNQLAEIENNIMKLDPAAGVLVKMLTAHYSVMMKMASAANSRTSTIELNIILDSLVQLGNNLNGLKGVDLGAAIENTNSAFVHVCRLLLDKLKVEADFSLLAEKIKAYQALNAEERN
ncbi:MAG TPA: hypothetical protein PLV52_00585, partial [Candidatus Omnitrophota bacterium]|nr:hypothetical protein [Candidatus Omnitrophota bacterium]